MCDSLGLNIEQNKGELTPIYDASWMPGRILLYLELIDQQKLTAWMVSESLVDFYKAYINVEPCKIRHQWQHITHQVITTCIVSHNCYALK